MYKGAIFLLPSRRVVSNFGIQSKEYLLHHCTEVHNCDKFQETNVLATCSVLFFPPPLKNKQKTQLLVMAC